MSITRSGVVSLFWKLSLRHSALITAIVLTTGPSFSQNGDNSPSKRDSVAAGLTAIFRRHYVDAHASAINNELVISISGADRRSQRDGFVSEFFPRSTQEGLCAIGFNKMLVTSGSFFGDQEEYSIRCKGDGAAVPASQAAISKRNAFAAHLKRNLSASPRIADVDARNATLEIVGKNGLDAKTMSSTFTSVMGTDFVSSACQLGFLGIRFKRTAADPGIYSTLACK